LDFLTGQKRDKPIAETSINGGAEEIDFENVNLPHMRVVCHAQKGGRPQIDNPDSATLRKRRQRQRQKIRT
jgi:hypothetical protein